MLSPVLYVPLMVVEEKLVTVGATLSIPSTTMALLAPSELAAVGDARVSVASTPVESLIVAPLRVRALVDV